MDLKKLTHNNLPASVGFVKEVRAELKEEIGVLGIRMDAMKRELETKIDQLGARFDKMEAKYDARFDKMEAKYDARFGEMEAKYDARFDMFEVKYNARFDKMEAENRVLFGEMMKSHHRLLSLMEEQRSENRIVLDGLKTLAERQDRLELDNKEIRSELRAFTSVRR